MTIRYGQLWNYVKDQKLFIDLVLLCLVYRENKIRFINKVCKYKTRVIILKKLSHFNRILSFKFKWDI